MARVAIITDSVACLPPEYLQEYDIYTVPVKLVLDGKVYSDGVDISASQAYDLLRVTRQATTSAPSPGDILLAYREVARKASQVLCLTVSSRLSALYSASLQARGMAREEMPGVRIEVLDTGTATAAQGFVVLAAARAARAGEELSQVVEAAERVKGKVHVYILLDTLRYVHRTGRVPHLASRIGSLLPVKPILTVSGGEVRFLGAVRTRARGVERLVELLREKAGERPIRVAVTHAASPEEAQELKGRVQREFRPRELFISDFSPVMGYAAGPGVLAVAFYPED